jgi:pyrroline-5-carboxylate reductase
MSGIDRKTVGFIGGGNMAEAMVRGLVAGPLDAKAVLVAEPVAARRRQLQKSYGVGVTEDNRAAAAHDLVVLAVKPQVMGAVLEGLAGIAGPKTIFVSIAAGVKLASIEKALGARARVVRVMPNTPCLVGRGASVLCGGASATRADVKLARELFENVGRAWTVDSEKLLDAVTGLSGSGPAYVYRFAEALIAGGKRNGLDPELAEELAFQTIAGAAEMMLTTGRSPEDLRAAVSSPGGTTLAGLARLDELNFAGTVREGVTAATKRARELGKPSRG